MDEEILNKIRNKCKESQDKLEQYNSRAKIENEMAKHENIKKALGLPYTENLGMPIKDETDVILELYKKYKIEINENDTNNIYVYVGTFRYLCPTIDQIEAGYPLDEEVDRNDPRGEFRIYRNLEGIWSYKFNIEKSLEFEENHTVLFPDRYSDVEKDFVLTAVKEGQEKAVNLVLEKYKK